MDTILVLLAVAAVCAKSSLHLRLDALGEWYQADPNGRIELIDPPTPSPG